MVDAVATPNELIVNVKLFSFLDRPNVSLQLNCAIFLADLRRILLKLFSALRNGVSGV